MVDLFEPEDVEDLVLLWLQQQGWLLIPSSRKHDTPMYEARIRMQGWERNTPPAGSAINGAKSNA